MKALLGASGALVWSLGFVVAGSAAIELPDNGQSTLPGVHSGANSAGAELPMQLNRPPSQEPTRASLR